MQKGCQMFECVLTNRRFVSQGCLTKQSFIRDLSVYAKKIVEGE